MEKKREIARLLAKKYHTLPVPCLERLAEAIVPFKTRKGTKLLEEGQVQNYLLYVEKGLLRQYYFKYNKELTENLACDNEVVMCLESFLRRVPSTLVVEALENSAVWGIAYDDLQRITAESHEIELLYRSILEHSLVESQRKADMLRFEPSHVRYKRLLEYYPEIIKCAPLVYIASFLQMTPETLSRVRSGQL